MNDEKTNAVNQANVLVNLHRKIKALAKQIRPPKISFSFYKSY